MTRTAFVILTCLAALLGVTANVAHADEYYYRGGAYHYRSAHNGYARSICCYRKVVRYVRVRTVHYVRVRPQRRYDRLGYYPRYDRARYYDAPRYADRPVRPIRYAEYPSRPHRYAAYPSRSRRFADLNSCRRVSLRVIDARDRIVRIWVLRCE